MRLKQADAILEFALLVSKEKEEAAVLEPPKDLKPLPAETCL
jgi:hypothetical protein